MTDTVERRVGRRIILLLSIPAVLIVLGVSLAGVVPSLPYGVNASNRERYEAKLEEISLNKAAKERAKSEIGAEVYVPEAEHDFGYIDPGTVSAHHDFEFENRGTGDLLLEPAGSSCKCTVAELNDPIIGPGESVNVRVVWNSGADLSENFEQVAIVRTNDPDRPEVELTVRGKVARPFAFSGPIQGGTAVLAGQPMTGTALIYSQTHNNFVVLESEASSERVELDIQPVDLDAISHLRGRAGFRVKATYRPTDGRDSVNEWVKVRVMNPETGDEEWLKTAFVGHYKSRVSFIGPELHRSTGVNLGLIELGSDQSWSFGVRFRGSPPPSRAVIKDIEPDSLEASIEASDRLPGVFRVTVRLAKDAVPARFVGDPNGFVEVAAADDLNNSGWLPVTGQIIRPVEP